MPQTEVKILELDKENGYYDRCPATKEQLRSALDHKERNMKQGETMRVMLIKLVDGMPKGESVIITITHRPATYPAFTTAKAKKMIDRLI